MLKNLIGAYKNELILFAGAFFARALYAVGLQATAGSHGFISFADAQYFYLQLAQNLLNHGAFSVATSAPYYPDAYHTPLYPLFLAILLFFHLPLLGVALAQDALAAFMVVLTYRIALRLTASMPIALGASILVAIEPMSIYWNNLLMSDTLFAFLTVLSLYLLRERRPYLSIAALALATLTRPLALYFFPLFLLMIVYQAWSASLAHKEVLKNCALTALIFIAIVSPWYIRNKIDFGVWSLSSAGWYELYVAPLSDFAHAQGIAVPPLPVQFTPDTALERFNFEYDAFYKQAFISIVAPRPLAYARFQLARWSSALASSRYEYLAYGMVAVKFPGLFARVPSTLLGALLTLGEALWIALYLLAAVAGLDKKLHPWWLFFAALVLINLLTAGLVGPSGFEMSRYEMCVAPVLFIFAGAGARYIKNRVWSIV